MRPWPSPLIVPEQPVGATIRVSVLRVFDGDGFVGRVKACELTGNPWHQHDLEVSARFGFIDAPEIDQPGGREAKNFLESLIGGRSVELAILMKMDTGGSLDRHGRVVCVPYLAERSPGASLGMTPSRPFAAATAAHSVTRFRNIELEMVVNGWAWVLARYGPDQRYFDALDDAQQNRRGIWAFDNNVAPWEFKRRKRQASRINCTSEEPVRCPNGSCGGRLLRRNGRHGAFLGCSNFPNCRYSKAYSD